MYFCVQSYQTDVTVSSEASDEEDEDGEDNMSADSQASGVAASDGEYTPVEISSGDDSDGPDGEIQEVV